MAADHNNGAPGPSKLAPGLYVTATPIGNLADITARALDVLAAADVIAAEDTRRTARLLAHHGLTTPMTPYHDHNAARALPGILRRLRGGASVALVSDAGTPLVSDPGYKLVRACLDEGIPVTPLPGASSVLAALVVSGLPAERFFFAGFLPPKTAGRKRVLGDIANVPGALVFMESAKRLAVALVDMAGVLTSGEGQRQAVICREMTKKFEEVRRGSLADLADHYKTAGAPKGEVTIVVAPGVPEPVDDGLLDKLLTAALKNSTVRDAANAVSKDTGLSRRRVYARALELKPGHLSSRRKEKEK